MLPTALTPPPLSPPCACHVLVRVRSLWPTGFGFRRSTPDRHHATQFLVRRGLSWDRRNDYGRGSQLPGHQQWQLY